MSNNSTFDDDEMIQILIKKSFQVPATYEQTKWFNEAKGVSRTILEASDINSKTVPTTPIWGDASLNESDLDSYGIKLDPTQNFAASPYDEIHTFADATYLSYSKTISIDPGAYIDYTGTVMLFVKLKLDRMDAPSASAIAYTKYHIDSSQNSILDNAYQFNYNQQRNVLDSSGNFISLFKPYAYYLELSTDGGYNCDLLSPDHGNWFFDFKSGIITFSDDPNDSSFGADAKDVTNGDLYFTFVKYVGPRGLDKLISVDDDFDSTATSGFYKNQIVVDSSNSEIYLMKDGSWNSIGGGGGGGSETVNLAGQTFHEVVTGAPQAFTKGGISNTLFTIDISWNFDDIQPSESNRLFNFPLPNKRDRVIPYMSHIYFDISSSTSDISFSENIEIDSSHNYAEDSKTVSGHIESSGGDLSYNLTYRTLTLTKFSEDTRTYTVNVWGVNESNESDVYKLPFVDISFVPDSEALPVSLDYSMNTYETISGDLFVDISDSDGVNGKIVRFNIDNSGTIGGFTWDNSLNTSDDDGVTADDAIYYSSNGKWSFSPEDISGNTTIRIKTWTDFYVNGQGVSAEFYDDSDVSGFTSTIDINIFVDAEANFNPAGYSPSGTSGISQDGEVVTGIVYATDTDGAISFSVVSSLDGTDNSLNISTDYGASAEILSQSDVSAEWKYTPVQDWSGNDYFFIRTTDTSGGFTDISINIFVDAEANIYGDLSGISQTGSEDVSGIVYANDSDGTITFSISGGVENPSNSGLWQYHTGDGSANIVAFSDLSAEWKYTPDSDFSGNDTFFIRTTDTSGGFTDISINIFVDAEANFNPTPNTSDTSGISQTDSEPVYGIVYATDTDGDISFSVVSILDGTDNSLNISTDYGASAEILFQSDVSAEWKYTPVQDWSGNDTFFIRTTDTSGGITDISINIFVDAEASVSHDPSEETSADSSSVFIGDINETITVRVDASDTDGDISFSISNPPQDGSAEILHQTDSYVDWKYTPDTDFSGNDTFTIQTTDTSGGTTDIIIKVIVSVFYQIATISDLSSNMKSVHSGLLPLGGSSTGQVQNYNSISYNWFVYKVDESETSTEYLPSENSSTGTAGINLSRIMETQFGDSSENAFSNSLYNTASNDILVYIVATRKLTDDYYMARISNLSQGPGFDEMNPWYWNNKVTESSLSSLTSGSGSGALPSTSLQAEIRNNDNTSTVFATSNDSDIAIYTHSNVLQDHYFYFAFKN